MEKIDFYGTAHEIWATAQIMPEEGIEDGVQRVYNILIDNFNPTKPEQSFLEERLNKAVEHGQAKPCRFSDCEDFTYCATTKLACYKPAD